VSDAIALFNTVTRPATNSALSMQYDYMSAYFDFFTGQAEGFKIARSIVRNYEDYPIPALRISFLEILYQLNEYDGKMHED